jgi:transcriptional regulator with XRE-family HTH domain
VPTEYGTAPSDHERILKIVRCAGKEFGQRILARASDTSLGLVSAILRGKHRPRSATLAKLYRALPRLEREASDEAEQGREVLEAVKRYFDLFGLREFARWAGVDGPNLAKFLSGRRQSSRAIAAKLQVALARDR